MNTFNFPGRGRLHVLALASLVWTSPGCAGRRHTIEPGTWRLSIKGQETSPAGRSFAPREPLEVEVSLDWRKSEELLRVQYQEPPSQDEPEGKKYVLAGKIDEDGRVDLKGSTSYWLLQFFGKVASPRLVKGSLFARMRTDDQQYFDGTWSMAKVQPPRE